jgi:hypothetical protein
MSEDMSDEKLDKGELLGELFGELVEESKELIDTSTIIKKRVSQLLKLVCHALVRS